MADETTEQVLMETQKERDALRAALDSIAADLASYADGRRGAIGTLGSIEDTLTSFRGVLVVGCPECGASSNEPCIDHVTGLDCGIHARREEFAASIRGGDAS